MQPNIENSYNSNISLTIKYKEARFLTNPIPSKYNQRKFFTNRSTIDKNLPQLNNINYKKVFS